jgi:hypothetical protein
MGKQAIGGPAWRMASDDGAQDRTRTVDGGSIR